MKKVNHLACALIISTSFLLPGHAEANTPKQILFSGGSLHNPGIYKMNEDTTEVTRIIDGMFVDVSPDGKKLAFIKKDSLYVSDADGKNTVRLTHSRFPIYDSSPRWSPDGSKIVFSRSDGNIYTIDADGKNLSNLTKTDETVINSEPDWSPDGSKIVFHSNRTGQNHIFVMNADGSNVKQLTGKKNKEAVEYSAHFSPDGKKIVYGSTERGQSDLYVMNADGSQPVNLTKDINDAVSSPLFSEDGKKIVFTKNSSEGSESSLLTMDPDGTDKATIKLDIGNAVPYDWQHLGEVTSSESNGLRSTFNYLSDLLFD